MRAKVKKDIISLLCSHLRPTQTLSFIQPVIVSSIIQVSWKETAMKKNYGNLIQNDLSFVVCTLLLRYIY